LPVIGQDVGRLFEAKEGETVAVVTVGNTLRSDDGAGPYIAARATRSRPGLVVIDAGERPEGILDRVIALAPRRVVFIDAADFGGVPGETRVIDEGAVPAAGLSTHIFPVPVVARLIAADTGAEISFVGIQAASVALGEGLTPPVREAADLLVALMTGAGQTG
jgi:hydrogenase 3 maturation protease